MFKKKTDLLTVLCLVSFTVIFTANVFATGTEYLSPIGIAASPNGKMLYLAQSTGQQIAYFDVAAEQVVKTISVAGKLSGLAVSPDGKKLYATAGDYHGQCYVVDVEKARVEETITLGHSPTAPVISIDGKTLYVCQKFNNNVAVVNLALKKVIAEIPVIRTPFAAAITPDGSKLYVANFHPVGRVDGESVASAVTVIDTVTHKPIDTITFLDGSIDLRGVAISPDGQYIYVTHLLAKYQLPTTQLERGWMNTNAITIINVSDDRMLTTVLLDDVDLGAANPWGLACTADGQYLCIAHAGTQEISVIDRRQMHQKISDSSDWLENIPNSLSFLSDFRQRIKLNGNGPRNLALIGNTAYIGEYFTDSLGVVDLTTGSAKSIKLGSDIEMTAIRKGEMLFNSASLCFQTWQSCASCHPTNGRAHPLNWDLMNDGIGNPKNTRSLLLSHETPPVMITGVRDKAETAVRAGIRHIQFAPFQPEDAEAIDEYLKTLTPIPSPYLVKTETGRLTLSRDAEEGKRLFEKANCAYCHSGPYFTNKKKYNVGTGKRSETDTAFDTPTLVEVWRTAPYLNDGSAATIIDVLTVFNKNDMHGQTSNLSKEQLAQLAEYILSL